MYKICCLALSQKTNKRTKGQRKFEFLFCVTVVALGCLRGNIMRKVFLQMSIYLSPRSASAYDNDTDTSSNGDSDHYLLYTVYMCNPYRLNIPWCCFVRAPFPCFYLTTIHENCVWFKKNKHPKYFLINHAHNINGLKDFLWVVWLFQ